jgi:phasin family protein
MIKTAEQFSVANKAAVDSMLTLLNANLAAAERLAALNLNTARAILADSSANAGALLAAKDPQSLIAVQKAMAKPAIDKAIAYSRGVYDIVKQSTEGVTQIAEGQAVELKKSFTAAIDQSLARAPAGSETIVAAVKTAMAAADQAYGTLTSAAKQATSAIEANVASATAATDKLFAKAA